MAKLLPISMANDKTMANEENKNLNTEDPVTGAETAQETAPEAEKAGSGQEKKSQEDKGIFKKGKKEDNGLKKQVEELTDKLAKEKEDYLRLMAEFDTFRRRSAEQRLSLIDSAAADTIQGLLPVLDDCERAMQMLAQSSDEAAREGTALIFDKLMAYLKTRGLSVIEAKGAAFDTDFHEAVTQFPAPSEELKGKVVDVIQTGYMLNGKVLRFAKVVVGV